MMANIQDQFTWFSINLSGQTIAHEGTYDIITRAIDSTGLPAEKI